MSEQKGIVPEAKTWTEPQLTVLTRSKPEETVLGVCKDSGIHDGSPQTRNNTCFSNLDDGCIECSQIVNS